MYLVFGVSYLLPLVHSYLIGPKVSHLILLLSNAFDVLYLYNYWGTYSNHSSQKLEAGPPAVAPEHSHGSCPAKLRGSRRSTVPLWPGQPGGPWGHPSYLAASLVPGSRAELRSHLCGWRRRGRCPQAPPRHEPAAVGLNAVHRSTARWPAEWHRSPSVLRAGRSSQAGRVGPPLGGWQASSRRDLLVGADELSMSHGHFLLGLVRPAIPY